MIVKLQGGPMHGKTVAVPDNYRSWTVRSAKKPEIRNWGAPDALAVFETVTSTYEMLAVPNPLRPSETIPCVSPKGEVYFRHRKNK